MKSKLFGLFLLVALWSLAQPREMWHHATSSYRAVYDITSRPSHAKGGVLLNVPVCGIGMADGEDVYCLTNVAANCRVCRWAPVRRTAHWF